MELVEPIAINTKIKSKKDLKEALQILQTWFSPSFPVGSFSYSHGLEAMINDSFINSKGGSPALRMEVDDKPEELTETHKEFINIVKKVSGENWNVGSISRQEFYEEAKKAYCIVTTTDARPFGCFILTKGVILPDGNVWT